MRHAFAAVAVILAAVVLSGCSSAQPVALHVPAMGTLSGEGWTADNDVVVTSDPEDSETSVEVNLYPTPDATDNQTPLMSYSFDTGGQTVTCDQFRTNVWSSDEPGVPTTLTILCDSYITPDELADVDVVNVAEQ